MAAPSKGILGGFSGKVGTVIGGEWKGQSYMRSLPTRKKNRKFTLNQQMQMARFKKAASFLKPFNELISLSFETPNRETGHNAALRTVIDNAITGQYPDFTIDRSEVQVAKGSLQKTVNPMVSSIGNGKLRFVWQSNDANITRSKDQAILVAYCDEYEDAIYTTNGGLRSSNAAELDVNFFTGKDVHTWIAFRSAEGKCSESRYLGTIAVS